MMTRWSNKHSLGAKVSPELFSKDCPAGGGGGELSTQIVVAKLAERLLAILGIHGLNPNIGKVFRIYLCISVNCYSEKKKRPGLARFFLNVVPKFG